MAIVAVGAEIPDTIQSVTVAKRGYGAMAVSNCLGSQICNICLGLGLPWTISNLLGKKVAIHKEQKLQRTAFFQVVVATGMLAPCWDLQSFKVRTKLVDQDERPFVFNFVRCCVDYVSRDGVFFIFLYLVTGTKFSGYFAPYKHQ